MYTRLQLQCHTEVNIHHNYCECEACRCDKVWYLCFNGSFCSNFGVLLSQMLSGIMTRRRSSKNSENCWHSFHVGTTCSTSSFFSVQRWMEEKLWVTRKGASKPQDLGTWSSNMTHGESWILAVSCAFYISNDVNMVNMYSSLNCELTITCFYAKLLFHISCVVFRLPDFLFFDVFLLSASHFSWIRTSAKAGQLGIIPGSTELKMSKWWGCSCFFL